MFKKPELLTIFLIVFVDVLGFTIILPLLPFYSESFGATPFIVGTIVSCYGFCQLLAGPLLGQLSDRVGRRPVLLLSQIGTLMGFILLALAHQLWMIFLARIIDGITAGNITVAQAYISDVTTPQERTRAMGMIGAAFGLGFILGPAISGVLAQFGHSAPIWVACGLSFLSICGSYFFLKDVQKAPAPANAPKVSRRQHRKELLASPIIRSYYISYLAFSFSFALFTSGLALYCERNLVWNSRPFSTTQIGYLLAFSGLINLSVQTVFIGRLVKRFGEELLVRIGFTCAAIGLFGLGLSNFIPLFLVGITLNSFGNALLRPSLTGLISKHVSPKHQGLALGFGQTLMSIAQIVCPLVSGTLIEHEWYFGFTATASVAAIVGLGSTVFMYAKKTATAEVSS
jgi:MFS transporter, DHA1 family, tetracycline resistance protein